MHERCYQSIYFEMQDVKLPGWSSQQEKLINTIFNPFLFSPERDTVTNSSKLNGILSRN